MPNRQTKRVASAFDIPQFALAELPTRLLAIDPGIIHCGMSEFERDDNGWSITDIADRSPLDLLLYTRNWIAQQTEFDHYGVITIEGYQLYPGKMQQQGMSRMGTPETIGAMKWLYLDECWVGWRSAERPQTRVALYEQGASIKEHGCKAMEILNPRDCEWCQGPCGLPQQHFEDEVCYRQPGKGWIHHSPQHQGRNPHERDAESHGWYRIKILEAERRKAEGTAARD